jgi:hypothetical protein
MVASKVMPGREKATSLDNGDPGEMQPEKVCTSCGMPEGWCTALCACQRCGGPRRFVQLSFLLAEGEQVFHGK